MVGRNKSYSADYFSHDADASSDEKVMYLESKFGHTGYAIYFKLLERMARADNFELCWDDIKISIYASEFGISVTEMKTFIKECCRKEIKAFVLTSKKLYSEGLKKRMQPLIEKRVYNRKKYDEKLNNKTNGLDNSVTETMLNVTEMTQRKGKERKGKDKRIADPDGSAPIKVPAYKTKSGKKLSGKRLDTFESFWVLFNFKKGKASAADSWLNISTLTDTITEQIFEAAKIEAERRPELIAKGSSPKWAQGWLTERRWEDEIYQPQGTNHVETPEESAEEVRIGLL